MKTTATVNFAKLTLTKLEGSCALALIQSAEGNGHDFGFTEDGRTDLVSAKSLPGVVASLQKKGIIDIESEEVNGYHQFLWPVDEGKRAAFVKALAAAATKAVNGGKAPKARPTKGHNLQAIIDAANASPNKVKVGKVTVVVDVTKDLKIAVLAKTNPKKGKRAQRFALYTKGMTVAEYIKAGGKLRDVRWDAAHGFIAFTK